MCSCNEPTSEKPKDKSIAGEDTPQRTVRSCQLVLFNNSKYKHTNLNLIHSVGDHNDTISVISMDKYTRSFAIEINFETGAGASKDYWNVSFKSADGKRVYRTPDNDRCNITSDDEGRTVTGEICDAKVDGQYYLYVNTPRSDGCYFRIEEVPLSDDTQRE